MPPPADSVAKLALIDPHHANAVVNPKPRFIGGYPLPGPQSISGTAAMNKTAFVDDNTWRILAEHGHFDDIVVGSGFCALAYITTALERDPTRKILLLERGGFWLQDHVQNLPAPFQFVRGHLSETFPWELAHATAEAGLYLSGSSPFFGGRSSFWSIWSPRAIGAVNGDDNDLMRGFPDFVKDAARNFYEKTERQVLHVQAANHITDPVFTAINLQNRVTEHLAGINGLEGLVSAAPAKLATALPLFGPSSTGYRHFSAIASLLTLNDRQNRRAEMKEGSPIMIATDTVVERFEVEPASGVLHAFARILHTSRGPLTLQGGKTNVILAAGAIPNTTILLNSIENPAFQAHAGQRLTAHFRSQVMARFQPDHTWFGVAADALDHHLEIDHPVISAHHVRGTHQPDDGPELHWHIQLHGIYVPRNFQQHHVQDIQGMVPDLWSAPTSRQLEDSGGYVVLTGSVLGELPEGTGSHLELIKGGDVTKNIRLHLELGGAANALWTHMITRTFATVDFIAADNLVEYWKYTDSKWDNPGGGATPEHHSKRNKSLFHEASTNYMAMDLPVGNPDAPADSPTVDSSYRPLGLQQGNVYVTGAGLFPTAGSWNPTPTICALAQHLATKLVEDTYLGRAAFNLNGTNTWFFNGMKYVRIEWAAGAALPDPVNDRIFYGPVEFAYEWRSLWHTGFRQIDVMVPVPGSPNEAYVFSGPEFARIGFHPNYDNHGVPRLIRDCWASLTQAGLGFTTVLCGALIDPNDGTRMFFFSGDQYVHVQWNGQNNADTLVNLNPGPGAVAAIRSRWDHLPEGRKFNTIFPDPGNAHWAYLFSGTMFWRINIVAPANDQLEGDVASCWPSLKKARFI